MSSTKQCVSDELLRSYLQSEALDSIESQVERHLEECNQCRGRLRELADVDAWWSEAESMLADYASSVDDVSGGVTEITSSPKRSSGIDAHLSHWMGPTDDPTKMGRIGPYEVIGIVGYGGAGAVLRAHDSRLNRPVAIKALLPALAHNPMARRRFERESRAVAAITHQNVVPIYAVDTYNDHPYIAMYYVGGQSLQQRLDRVGPLQVAEIARIAAQIALALAAAHAQGIIHRDIKPANILLESNVDRVYVTDFGLARVVDDASTHTGMVAGTPQYMSPEQCHGKKVDHRTDLFSLGSVMYAMCVGRPPFGAETLMGLLRKVCEATPRSIRELNPDVPEWLEAFIVRLLEKEPEDRFQSANEVAEILEAELAHLQNPTGVAAPHRVWMPPIDPVLNDSAISRRTLMIFSATALAAALLFAFMQTDGGEPNTSESAQASNPEAAAAPLIASKDDDGKTIYESQIEREFDVKPGGRLAIQEAEADIAVVGGDSEKVRIKVVRRVSKATSEENASAMLGRHDVEFEAKDNTVTARGKYEDAPQENADDPAQLLIRYEVSVPEHFHAMLATADGDVSIADLVGNAEISTSDGNVAAEKTKGDLKAKTSDGDVSLTSCEGNLLANTADGNVTLANCKGTVVVKTSDGDVSLENCDGEVVAQTSDGDIKLKDCDGGTIVATANEGNVDVENCSGVFKTKNGTQLVSPSGASLSF